MDTMPFGKHKGQPFAELPDGYLAWLLTIDISDWLRARVEAEALRRREASDRAFHDAFGFRGSRPGEDRPPPNDRYHRALPPDVKRWAGEIARAGYRSLAAKHHPDAGGKTEDMQAINAAKEALSRLIE